MRKRNPTRPRGVGARRVAFFAHERAGAAAEGKRPGAGALRRALFGLVCLVCAAMILGAATAADAQQVRRITFHEAVEIALAQNNALRRAENAGELDRIGVAEARADFLPDLSLSLSGSRPFESSADGSSVRAGLSAGMTLFNGFANTSDLRAARLEQEAGELDIERTRQTVVFDVITGYLALIEAQEQVRVREENLQAQEKQLESIDALVEGGERPISDRYQQQSSVASARLGLVEARRSLDLARVDLVQALQLDPTREYEFEIPPLPPAPAGQTPIGWEEVLARAFERRSDLQAQRSRVESASVGERVARSGRWPRISLSAGYGADYAARLDGSLFDQFDETRGGSVSLSLSLPLFDRFGTSHSVARAKIATENQNIALQDLRQDVALQVRRAVLDRNAAAERLQAAQAQALAAEKALEFTSQRYEAGVATLYEVTLARADFVAATSASVNARYNLLWQDRLLDYYKGDLDPSGELAEGS
ncbi:MAG: TolC family protein [Candidatus Eisenbacteria bacterium]|nr:TolC family protein [Candidatus Eisenbacteria bacterium]